MGLYFAIVCICRWFTWFYLLGAFVNGGALLFISDAYLNHRPLPEIVQRILAIVTSNKETSTGVTWQDFPYFSCFLLYCSESEIAHCK